MANAMCFGRLWRNSLCLQFLCQFRGSGEKKKRIACMKRNIVVERQPVMLCSQLITIKIWGITIINNQNNMFELANGGRERNRESKQQKKRRPLMHAFRIFQTQKNRIENYEIPKMHCGIIIYFEMEWIDDGHCASSFRECRWWVPTACYRNRIP